MTESIIIVGAGGHARVLASALKAAGKVLTGFVDRDASLWGTMIDGSPVLGGDDFLERADGFTVLVNGVGSTELPIARREIFERFSSRGFRFASVVHPSAIVATGVDLGDGAQLMAGTVLQPGVVIGVNSIINTGAIIDHDSKIGAHCHVAPGCTLSGSVQVGDASHIGIGATVIESIRIGANVVVGAGTVVIRDLADGKRVIGIPARDMTS